MINEMQPLKFENIMIMQEWNSDLHTHRILLTCNLYLHVLLSMVVKLRKAWKCQVTILPEKTFQLF